MVTAELEIWSDVSDAQCHRAKNTLASAYAVPVAALLAIALGMPARAAAQEVAPLEVAGGYTFLDSSEIVDAFGAGWVVGGAWNATRWLALAIEVNDTGQQQSEGFLHVDASFFTILAGPRAAASVGRLRPFVQVLAGRSRLGIVASSDLPLPSTGHSVEVHPALQIGGGVDIPVDGGFSVRVAFDYRRVFGPENINQRRFLTGLVYGFPMR